MLQAMRKEARCASVVREVFELLPVPTRLG